MIDRHYGHLARDGRTHAIELLDNFTGAEAVDVHAVDVAWTSKYGPQSAPATETTAEQG